MSDGGPSDSTWLSLLCWESTEASELPNIVETVSFEPHPVSGEVEFGDIDRIQYRKLDEETLQSVLRLPDTGLEVLCVWCEDDQEGGEDGWRINELRPLRDASKDTSRPWYNTISEADEKFEADATRERPRQEATVSQEWSSRRHVEEPTDNDDAYWAQYDQTQSQTPAQRLTPNPPSSYSSRRINQAEDDYYARYEDVQPAMDNDDPAADHGAIGYSSLPHDSSSNTAHYLPGHMPDAANAETGLAEMAGKSDENLIHTRPSSSSSSAVVAQLESSAQSQSHAEVAIQQHISTTMKSLYRLTRGAGIELSEFQRIVRNELETVAMMDEE